VVLLAGRWEEARAAYVSSQRGFQAAKGFRGRNGSTTNRLDGAVYAASNAALALVQLGEEQRATKEIEAVARRAPNSSDMRVALAALYWDQGKEAAAEEQFDFACQHIMAGCSKYRDIDWVSRIRRWPPAMVDKLQSFLAIQSSSAATAASLKPATSFQTSL